MEGRRDDMRISLPSSTGAPAFIPSPGVSRVVLASTSQFALAQHELSVPSSPSHLGLMSIQYGLREAGFRGTSIFHASEGKALDLITDERLVVDAFKRLGAAEKGAVIGLSTTSDEAFKFPILSRLMRRAFPGAQIVAGGVHFYRDRIEGHDDFVASTLLKGLADAVQVGHAQGFIDLIARHKGRREEVQSPGFYQLSAPSGSVAGKGVGKFPKLASIPHDYDHDERVLSVMLKDTCKNRCDFCTAALGTAPSFSPAVAIEGLCQLLDRYRPVRFRLLDSNPFDGRDMDYYAEVFEAMDRTRSTLKAVYLNPGLLTTADDRTRLLRFFRKHSVVHFFAGRDAVMENSAQAMGSRYHGQRKNQKQLDAEADGLFDVLCRLRSVPSGNPINLITSYIVTPFETAESAQAIMDDIDALAVLVCDELRVSAGPFPLMPYPGSALRRLYTDRIDLGEHEFHKTSQGTISPWKAHAGPSIPLMMELWNRIHRGDEEVHYMRHMREAIARMPSSPEMKALYTPFQDTLIVSDNS